MVWNVFTGDEKADNVHFPPTPQLVCFTVTDTTTDVTLAFPATVRSCCLLTIFKGSGKILT